MNFNNMTDFTENTILSTQTAVTERKGKNDKNDNKNKNKDNKSGKKSKKRADDDGDEDDDIDVMEYRKMLSNIFPSKYMKDKVSAGEKLKKQLIKDMLRGDDDSDLEDGEIVEDSDDECESDEEEEEDEDTSNKNKKKNKKNKKKAKATKMVSKPKKKVVEESESEESGESEDDDDFDAKAKKFNIIFTIGGGEDDDDDEEWEEYDSDDDEDYETEDEDEDVSSDESEEDEDEEDDEEEESEVESEEEVLQQKKGRNIRTRSAAKRKSADDGGVGQKSDKKQRLDADNSDESAQDSKESREFMIKLKELCQQNKDDPKAKECVKVCEETIKEHEKKQKRKNKKYQEKNTRIFKRLVKDKNTNNDFEFFGKLGVDEQKKIIKELRDINQLIRVEKPYRLTLLESDIPTVFKGAAMKKVNSLRYMEPGSGEYYKMKNWVDTFMRVPFGKYSTLPISMENGVDECHKFMEEAKSTLDNAVYGLNDAKMQIMQMMGQLLTNPSSIGTAIAIQGPMGTGKTTLVKEGISKILNRPFAFIALGGATDSSFLEGHSYTYEGSTWGKIVQILVDSKCMNPVIYFDELDKISDTPKGEEIAGILTHLTDTSQNTQYHDKYFAEIDFDLSKCLFIFSYNDESKINPILRDRMYRIHTKGYDKKQKSIIANNYLLPTIREQVKFNTEDIVIPEETLHHIMESFCNKEDGVRNMKRCLEIVYTKLNLYRLMKPDTNLFEENMTLKVTFPFTVTIDVANKLIKKDGEENQSFRAMYI